MTAKSVQGNDLKGCSLCLLTSQYHYLDIRKQKWFKLQGFFFNIIFSKKHCMNGNHFLKIQIRKIISEIVVKRTDLDFVHHTRSDVNSPLHRLKVSQFQKQIFLFSFAPNERFFLWFMISAIRVENGSTEKIKASIKLNSLFDIITCLHFFALTHFEARADIKTWFRSFLLKWEQENLLLKFIDL